MHVWFLVACTGPAQNTVVDPPKPVPTGPTGPTLPTEPIDTADTGTTTPEPSICSDLPRGPFQWVASDGVHTEEDFDFDANGYLVHQSFQDLLGVRRDGSFQLIATGIGQDIAGVRTLTTGDYIVAQQDTQAVRRVDAVSRATTTIFGGLDFPNGLEVDSDGFAYVSEYARNGRVRMFDPYSGQNVVIAEIQYPNGLALSPDEQTLYIATSTQQGWGSGRIAAIDRDPGTGEWNGTARSVFEAGDLVDAITTDICGNLYITEYNSGKVFRVRTDGTQELLVDLPNSGFEGYCAARFGAGIGDWSNTVLYVSDRSDLYGIEMGVPGRHVLAP